MKKYLKYSIIPAIVIVCAIWHFSENVRKAEQSTTALGNRSNGRTEVTDHNVTRRKSDSIIDDQKARQDIENSMKSDFPDLAFNQEANKIISERGGLEALKFFKTFPSGIQRTNGIGLALFEISRHNRMEALELARDLNPSDVHGMTIPSLFMPSGPEDFKKAMDTALSLPRGDMRDQSLSVLIGSGNYIDIAVIEDLLSSDKISNTEKDLLNACYAKSLIKDDVISAAKAIEMLKGPAKQSLVNDLMSQWPKDKLEEAAEWIYRNELTPQMKEMALQTLVDRSFKVSDAAAIELVNSLPPGAAGDATYLKLTNLLYDKDKASAQNWIESLGPGKTKEMAIEAYCMRSLDSDPAKSIMEAGQFGNESEVQIRIQGNLVSKWASQDPESAYSWVEKSTTLDENLRNAFRQNALMGWAASAPEEMMQNVKRVDFKINDQVAATLVDAVSAKGSYSLAASWISDNGWETPSGVSILAGRWLREDPVKASDWISKLPRGEVYDAGVRTLIDEVANDDPKLATQWANSISDPKLKSDMLHKINSK